MEKERKNAELPRGGGMERQGTFSSFIFRGNALRLTAHEGRAIPKSQEKGTRRGKLPGEEDGSVRGLDLVMSRRARKRDGEGKACVEREHDVIQGQGGFTLGTQKRKRCCPWQGASQN